MKIGVIGCGNMGSAIVAGLSREKAHSILVYDIDKAKMKETAARWTAGEASSPAVLAALCQAVILAVKPGDVEQALKGIKIKFDTGSRILITIAAGIKVAFYRKYLKKTMIARAMPNSPALVGEGVSGVYFDGEFSAHDRETVINILKSVGIAEIVSKEELLDAVTGLSGSGPAYVFAFINALADAGVMEGLPRDTARRLAVYTVGGSAVLAAQSIESGIHLEELKDRVTSPAGTTAEGLLALEEGSFNAAVIKAVRAAVKRSRQLGEK
jgi:pyrroline-5-carboxylate reductase